MNETKQQEEALSFLRPPEVVAQELVRSPQVDAVFDNARRRAAALGLDLDSILQQDAERLATYPTAECLTPSEVLAVIAKEWSAPSRLDHVRTCEYCARVLVAAEPTPEQLERFLDELGSVAMRTARSESVATSST